jgi:hypothetical protein
MSARWGFQMTEKYRLSLKRLLAIQHRALKFADCNRISVSAPPVSTVAPPDTWGARKRCPELQKPAAGGAYLEVILALSKV